MKAVIRFSSQCMPSTKSKEIEIPDEIMDDKEELQKFLTLEAAKEVDLSVWIEEAMSEECEPITVIRQDWEESEAGWGVRPDGCSLHIDEAAHNAYINRIYKGRDKGPIPHEYDRTSGKAYPFELKHAELIRQLQEKKTVRVWNHEFRQYGLSYGGQGSWKTVVPESTTK